MVLLWLPQKWGTTQISDVLLFLKFNSALPITQKDATSAFTCGSNHSFPSLFVTLPSEKKSPSCCHLPLEARAAQEGSGSAGCLLSQMSDDVRSRKSLFLSNKLNNPKKYSFLSLKIFLEVNSQWSSWKWILHCTSVSRARHLHAPHCQVHFLSVSSIF